MPKIGSRALAKEIFDFNKTLDWWNETPPPKGWKRFGSDNSSRDVYLHKPTDVVYKVGEHVTEYDGEYGNYSEIRNARYLAKLERQGKLPPNVRIPITSCFVFDNYSVIAMQRIKGRLGNASMKLRTELHALKFSDMHDANFIVCREKKIWPIDMGSPRTREVDDRLIGGKWWFE